MTIAVNRNLSNCESLPRAVNRNSEATDSNPVEAPKNFFSGYFRNCLNCDSLRWSHINFICIPAVHIISFCVNKSGYTFACRAIISEKIAHTKQPVLNQSGVTLFFRAWHRSHFFPRLAPLGDFDSYWCIA